MSGRLENLVGVLVLAADDRVRPVVERTAGLRGSAAAALVHLASYGGESVEQLSRVLGISQPGAVAVVDRLVSGGLVTREAGADRRTHALQLTDTGRARVATVLEARRRALADLLAPLEDEQRETLSDVLETVVHGLATDRPQARTVCRLCDRDACARSAGCPLDHTVQS